MNKFLNWIHPNEPSATETSRLNNFNIVRFIASIMVIYGHMMHIMGVPIFTVYNQAVSTIAVKIFFVISGYLIAKSWFHDAHWGRYLLRRCFRIFPALITVVLVSIFLVGPLTTVLTPAEYFASPYTWMYLKNIALSPIYSLPGCFGTYTYPNAINGSLWTLPVEFSMYLILPLFLLLFRKMKKPGIGIGVTFAILTIADVVYLAFFPGLRFVVYGSNLPDAIPLVPFFFAGCLFALPDMKKYLNLELAAALIIAGALVNWNAVCSELYLLLVLPYFILSFSLTPQPLFSKCFAKCDFSYGMYLYGFVIQQLIWNALKNTLPPQFLTLNKMTLICLIATLACAVASWYLIEKPMQKLGKKLIQVSVDRNKKKQATAF